MVPLWFSKHGWQGQSVSDLGALLVCLGPITIRKFQELLKGAALAEQHGLVGVGQLGSQKVWGSNPTMISMLASKAANPFLVCQREIMTLMSQDCLENSAQHGSCHNAAIAINLADLL